jgi:hypothetical protein
MLYPALSVSTKFGIPLGTRLGISAKDDRQYGVELNIDIPAEEMILDGDQEGEGGEEKVTKLQQQQHHHHKHWTLETLKAAQDARWKDMEWRMEATAFKFYNGADLLIGPYQNVRWDAFACAYMNALKSIDLMKVRLDAYNNLAKVFQNDNSEHAILKPKEITNWITDVDSLQSQLPPTSALAQACRRLKSKSGLLTQRAESYLRKHKKAQDDERNVLSREAMNKTMESPLKRAMDRLKWEFKMTEGIWSPQMRRHEAKEKVRRMTVQAFKNGKEVVTDLAQQAKDNMENIRKL